MKKILIIEDANIQRRLYSGILDKEFDLSLVENGEKALEMIPEGNFDLLICDLKMPGISGREVLEKVKELNIDLPSIVVSADVQNKVKEECFSLGAKEFLEKPVDRETLLSSIKKILS